MQYYSRIKGIKETEEGTDLIIHIPDYHIEQKIRREQSFDAEIRINDPRGITAEQRKKIYATIRDIALYTGYLPEDKHLPVDKHIEGLPDISLKGFLKDDYCGEAGVEYFSLSDCSLDTAREFINYLIEFILKNDIPLSNIGLDRTDDISSYLYYCIKYRKCCITGKPADIHHVEGSRIGMGGNRKTTSNEGRELMALNRDWHSRVHIEGEEAIFKAYKIYGITLDKRTLAELEITEADIT